MTSRLITLLTLLAVVGCSGRTTGAPVGEGAVASPDGRVVVSFRVDESGTPRYLVTRDGTPAMEESRLGLVRDDADFSTGLRLRSVSRVTRVEDRYEILTAKRRNNVYQANRRVFQLETADGRPMDIEFQVSNDGVGFRYTFPNSSAEQRRLVEERTSFRFSPEARAWLQPMQRAKTGWGDSNPAYEEYYQMEIPVGTPSTLGAGWVFPALFRSGDTWVLVSETGLGRDYAGTRLRHESPDREYMIGFPDPRESRGDGPVEPTSTLPWSTPWRIIVVGGLDTIVESMLGIDLAIPAVTPTLDESMPGRSAWSWVLLGDNRTEYNTQREFIDYAADMGWEYVLVDALWDVQIGYERVQELVDYARSKGVRILLWYNSAGPWNTTPQTPRDVMMTRERRLAEFARLRDMGVAGLKIDFFGADGQDMIEYYHDLMSDAAEYGLSLNFHGATLPRGWSRTYPHLMTMEAVKGLEFATFGQENADAVPTHVTVLPFTRNAFDPMDFTPMALNGYPRTRLRTTAASELAQAVLFTSGITHYAETPAGMARAPEYVRTFLRGLPVIWDDVRFLAGYPGQYVALARRAGDRWWIAAANGEDRERTFTVDLGGIAAGSTLTMITDGNDPLGFASRTVQVPASGQLEITLAPRGGMVATTAQ